jgi:Asp/Glu/hydantoin racemase
MERQMTKMTRVLYLNLNGAGLWDDILREVLEPWRSPGTDLVVDHLAEIPPAYHCVHLAPGWPFLNELMRRVGRAEAEGFHAVVIGCSADPGYREARRFFKIPVVAPLTANLHLASLLKGSVAVLSPALPGSRKVWSWYKGLARTAGLESQVVAWLGVPTRRTPAEVERRLIVEDPKRLAAMELELMREPIVSGKALEIAKKAVWEDGAEAVYFACTLWSGMLGSIAAALDVPVLDAAGGALKVAEALGGIYAAQGGGAAR